MEAEKGEHKKLNLLIGLCGSVAIQCVDDYIEAIQKTEKFNIKLVLTQQAEEFLNKVHNKDIYYPKIFLEKDIIYTDQNEKNQWNKPGDIVPHLYLKDWADILLIAPLTANTMGKISNGLADNLLTCIARAWEFEKHENGKLFSSEDGIQQELLKKPFIVAPAMNTAMYNHPITSIQINTLKSFGITVMQTQEGLLASHLSNQEQKVKKKGKGALAKKDNVLNILISLYSLLQEN